MVNVADVNVLAELGQATWTTPRAIGYETVLEGVRQSIGLYSQFIATEEQSDEPDTGTIERWRSEQLSWATRGQELTLLDTRATESLLEDAEKLLEDDDDDDEDDDDEDEDESDDEAQGG